MLQYLVLAETIFFKNDRLTCINIYDNFRTVAMPSEFTFDMAISCGPKWTVGEHKVEIKAVASNGKEINLGTADVNIPNEDFVYHIYLNNIKITMDYSVSDLTFYVYCDGNEIISRKYPVISMLVPQKQNENNNENLQAENSENSGNEASQNGEEHNNETH